MDIDWQPAGTYSDVELDDLNDNQQLLFKKAVRTWRPPENLTVSQWAEKHFVHEKGSLKLIEFQKGILDAFSNPEVENITFMKSARVGATMSMVIACVYYAAQDPMHLMLVQPTDDDCRGISTDHIGPAYDRSPQTQALFAKGAATRNTLTHKVFPGGSLKILAAKSPRNLRRHDVDVLMLDEVDGYETTVEGSPIELAKRRTQNSARRKIFMASTPVNEQTSEIGKSFNDSDQRHYYVHCPHCGASQTLEWEFVCINGRRATTMRMKDYHSMEDPIATVQCKHCEELIEEHHKGAMLKDGEWIAHAPFNGHAGFHINTLYSPFPNASWQKLVLEYLRAKRSPDTLQTFVNTVLGLCWSDNLDDLDAETISKRTGDWSLDMVPEDVLLMTAGVDVQKDRAEITYLGWCENGETKVLGHEKLYGDPTGDKLWDDLDDIWARDYPHELGGTISVSAKAVDSGNWTQSVYAYTANRQIEGLYAIKGVAGARPIWAESKIRPGQGGKLYNVGVDTAKTTLMQRLTVSDPKEEGYISFCEGLDFSYFEELIAEYRMVEYKHNRPVFVWQRKEGQRAEAMDCFVYALAARQTLSPNWQRLREDLKPEERQQERGSTLADLGRMGRHN